MQTESGKRVCLYNNGLEDGTEGELMGWGKSENQKQKVKSKRKKPHQDHLVGLMLNN
jgi:hypothetical protein